MSKLTLEEGEEDTAGQTHNQLYPEGFWMAIAKLGSHESSQMQHVCVRKPIYNIILCVFSQENQAVM